MSANKNLPRPPQVDKVLREEPLAELSKTIRRDLIAVVVRQIIETMRQENGDANSQETEEQNSADTSDNKDNNTSISLKTAQRARARLDEILQGGLRKVINGTGVLLSTNLGRAPLGEEARQWLNHALSGYSNLEYDLEEGGRGERTEHISELLSLLTGAEAAIVVNNNASAVMLAVMALSSGKETVISRGELIEIGGSFRLPDVIQASGGVLKEVGTTNRTRISDYEKALGDKTGLLMKCHRSNYQVVGFTEETTAAELADLAKRHAVPTVYDLGGGCLIDLASYDLLPEPTVQETLRDGIDLVLFSGDKLLGGPQAGIIAGRKSFVSRLRKCPIYRALRADKVVIGLLESALKQYLYVDGAAKLPVYKFAALKKEALLKRAVKLKDKLSEIAAGSGKDLKTKEALQVEAVELKSTMGGGSLPGELMASAGLALSRPRVSAHRLAEALRSGATPVIATVADEKVLIDLRAVAEEEEDLLCRCISEVAVSKY